MNFTFINYKISHKIAQILSSYLVKKSLIFGISF